MISTFSAVSISPVYTHDKTNSTGSPISNITEFSSSIPIQGTTESTSVSTTDLTIATIFSATEETTSHLSTAKLENVSTELSYGKD